MTGDDDRMLVEAVASRRDPRAFAALYARHTPAMYGLALRLTAGSESDAEDLVHDAWIRAVERLDAFEWRSALRSWLSGFVVLCSRELRRAQGKEEMVMSDAEEVATLDAELELTADRLDLERAVQGLANRYREVLLLHDVEGFTHQEIGSLLGIDPGTSKSQLVRARRAMRRALQAQRGGHCDERG